MDTATGRPPATGDLVVIEALNPWTCAFCAQTGDLLSMQDAGPSCLACADLDHLVFLPRGDTALTRRARKSSSLSAVVVRFSRARKRYERQGVLVEEAALLNAEKACLADADARARRRVREEERRAASDIEFQASFGSAIVESFPACPPERAQAIAAHAARRGSGRVGRSAAGRSLDPTAIRLAVVASIRHVDTGYDRLLMAGIERMEARTKVQAEVDKVLRAWSRPIRESQGEHR
jgi:hypothetical protein